MNKLSAYVNEMVSLVVMLLLLAALVSGQMRAAGGELAGAQDGRQEVSHVRLEGE